MCRGGCLFVEEEEEEEERLVVWVWVWVAETKRMNEQKPLRLLLLTKLPNSSFLSILNTLPIFSSSSDK